MLKVGLTGGYATGKTFVAAEFERLGCHLIFADQLGHATLQPGGAAYEPAIELFGRDILQADSTIDRKKLAAIVFGSPELLAKLNAVVHPAVFVLEEKMMADFATRDPHGIVVLEAAILIETGRYAHFDKLIVTACDQETQIVRGMKRDGVTREEVLARLSKQLSLEEKKRYADFVIDTSGSKEDTVRQVQQVFSALKQALKEGAEGTAL
jgi:dephospho-CoA kinase